MSKDKVTVTKERRKVHQKNPYCVRWWGEINPEILNQKPPRKEIPMPAYMISQVTVTDKEKFQSYLASTQSVAAKYGARPVAIGTQPKVLNGESDGHQMVFVIEFPTMEKLDAWHSSDEYQTLVSLREEGSDQRMLAYQGMAPTSS